MKTIPYTYLVKHKPSNCVYYGVRYAKNCHPDDFFIKYFTSSTTIKKLIDQDGIDSFEYEIRRTFTDASKARDWEVKVLRRMNVLYHDLFLNQAINRGIWKNNDWWKGKTRSPRTPEHTAKLVATFKARGRGIGNKSNTGRPSPKEVNAKISKTLMGRIISEETRRKMSDSHKGKPKSEAHCAAMSASRMGKPSCRKGAVLSDETKQKISNTKKAANECKRFLAAFFGYLLYQDILGINPSYDFQEQNDKTLQG